MFIFTMYNSPNIEMAVYFVMQKKPYGTSVTKQKFY